MTSPNASDNSARDPAEGPRTPPAGPARSLRDCAGRLVWHPVWAILFRLSPRPCHGWRRMLLRLFGAKVGRKVHVAPQCRIHAPWRLELGDGAVVGPWVDLYSVARISLGPQAIVSQYSYLCTASHDYRFETYPTTSAPIHVGRLAWVCAGAFVGPGVTVGDGAVVGARSTVVKDVPSWAVVAGNPARFIKQRELGRRPESAPETGARGSAAPEDASDASP